MILTWLTEHPWSYTVLWLCVLVTIAIIINFILQFVLLRLMNRLVSALIKIGNKETINIIRHLARIGPALVFSIGITMIPRIPADVSTVVTNVANAFIIVTIAVAIASLLDLINVRYQQRKDAHMHPIKGLIQVAKIALFAVTAILSFAVLIDKSPMLLLSGIGAMAAILMLVFQDTLLSFVAGIQISSTDMVRVGDWVEMPQQNADGDVIEIALHTVKVKNFDNTITTVPIRKLVSDSFKNWRGMQESGGRRIKRSIFLDLTSITFLSEDKIEELKQYKLIEAYLSDKQKDITEWNKKLGDKAKIAANTRRITNIGTFRAYCQAYLESRPDIHKNMTLLVRQLAPSSEGMPIELYCFSNTTAWAVYENIQADIFDHLYSMLPSFGLRVFQEPTGNDMHQMVKQNKTSKSTTSS